MEYIPTIFLAGDIPQQGIPNYWGHSLHIKTTIASEGVLPDLVQVCSQSLGWFSKFVMDHSFIILKYLYSVYKLYQDGLVNIFKI